MSIKFTVTENEVRSRDGESYHLGNYKEGEDYVSRKCFKSYKRMFREDILGGAASEQASVAALEEVVEVMSESKQPEQVQEEPARDQVHQCKIKRLYPNQRWVETDKGRVFVGLKGTTLRVNQIINVQNGELVTKLVGRKPSLVRL